MTAVQRDLTARVSAHLTDQWRVAFDATPRHSFVPDRALVAVNGHYRPIDRHTDLDTWFDAVYRDTAIIIRI